MPRNSPEIVLVTDRVTSHDTATLSTKTLEALSDSYFNDLSGALRAIDPGLTIYSSPRQLIENAGRHQDALVVSTWSGQGSRNRRALVPAICEAYGIRYYGADAYVMATCQDKQLSKEICHEFGLETPPGVLVRGAGDLELLGGLEPPLVVKPNLEGGSIGISSRNLAGDARTAADLALELLDIYRQPILVESFIEGDEISIPIVGTPAEIKLIEAMALGFEDRSIDIRGKLYGYETKKDDNVIKTRSVWTDRMSPETMANAGRLFQGLGKVGAMRIDGRLRDGALYVIELTPDVALERGCYLHCAFEHNGFSYQEMIREIVDNELGEGVPAESVLAGIELAGTELAGTELVA